MQAIYKYFAFWIFRSKQSLHPLDKTKQTVLCSSSIQEKAANLTKETAPTDTETTPGC